MKPHFFTLVTLIRHFNVESCASCLEQLNTLLTILSVMKRKAGGGASPNPDEINLTNLILNELRATCIRGRYMETLYQVEALRQTDVANLDYSTLIAKFYAVQSSLHAALQEHRFVQVDVGLSKYLEDAPDDALLLPAMWPLFTRNVFDAFPSATYDIREAGNCLAVECSTAAVFHLMRVAEHGMRALAWDRRVKVARGPVELATWEEIIRELEKAEQAIMQYPKRLIRDEQYDFYHGAMMDLRALKNAFRNQVMHTRSVYSTTEAVAIYERVSSFMNRLSLRIKEGTRTKMVWK